MKIAVLGDTHFGVHNASPIFDEYFKKFYKEIFFPYIKEHNIDVVLQLGDIVDCRKTSNHPSIYNAKKYFFDIFEEENIRLVTILGNHDIFYKDTLEISFSELFLEKYKNIEVIKKPTEYKFSDEGKYSTVLLLPWICKGNEEETSVSIKNTKCKVAFGHLELSGFAMNKGYEMKEGMESGFLKKFDNCWSGHYHTKSNKGNITYVGTPYEITMVDADDPKYFHVYDTDTGTMEEIRNPFTIYEKIVYNKDFSKDLSQYVGKIIKLTVEDRGDVKAYDKFILQLQNNNPADLKIIEETFEYIDDSVPEDSEEGNDIYDTMEIINNYIDGIDNINSNNIKEIFNKLYIEASN